MKLKMLMVVLSFDSSGFINDFQVEVKFAE